MSQHCCSQYSPAYLQETHTCAVKKTHLPNQPVRSRNPGHPAGTGPTLHPPDTVQGSSPGTAARQVCLAAAAAGGPWQPRVPLPCGWDTHCQQQALLLRPYALTQHHTTLPLLLLRLCMFAGLPGTSSGCSAQRTLQAHGDMQWTSQPGTLRAWVFFCCWAKITLRMAHQRQPRNPHWGCCCYCCGHAGGCTHRARGHCLQGDRCCHCLPLLTTQHNTMQAGMGQPGGWHACHKCSLRACSHKNMRQSGATQHTP
jgi:hypothetical protein